MEEGKLVFSNGVGDYYDVHSDIVTGRMEFIGVVRRERDTASLRAKRTKAHVYDWFAKAAGSRTWSGPHPTREGAALKLV